MTEISVDDNEKTFPLINSVFAAASSFIKLAASQAFIYALASELYCRTWAIIDTKLKKKTISLIQGMEWFCNFWGLVFSSRRLIQATTTKFHQHTANVPILNRNFDLTVKLSLMWISSCESYWNPSECIWPQCGHHVYAFNFIREWMRTCQEKRTS